MPWPIRPASVTAARPRQAAGATGRRPPRQRAVLQLADLPPRLPTAAPCRARAHGPAGPSPTRYAERRTWHAGHARASSSPRPRPRRGRCSRASSERDCAEHVTLAPCRAKSRAAADRRELADSALRGSVFRGRVVGGKPVRGWRPDRIGAPSDGPARGRVGSPAQQLPARRTWRVDRRSANGRAGIARTRDEAARASPARAAERRRAARRRGALSANSPTTATSDETASGGTPWSAPLAHARTRARAARRSRRSRGLQPARSAPRVSM